KSSEHKGANKYNVKGETSALATINSPKRGNTIISKRVPEETPMDGKTKDRCNNIRNIYIPTLKLRMEGLRKITACFKCLRTRHATGDCKKKETFVFPLERSTQYGTVSSQLQGTHANSGFQQRKTGFDGQSLILLSKKEFKRRSESYYYVNKEL
ncbi:unnamed protein product, partial [Wuchereria bancrofti]